jgi:DNA polymerase elongation subunit (family B)
MAKFKYRFCYLQVTTTEYRRVQKLFPHVAAATRLNVSGVIAGRGDNIQYVHTDSNHTEPLYRITPAKLISSKDYDREIFGNAPRFS